MKPLREWCEERTPSLLLLMLTVTVAVVLVGVTWIGSQTAEVLAHCG